MIRNMLDIKRGLASMVYKFLEKKTSGSGIKNENIPNKELSDELQKLIVTKFNEKSTLTFY